LPVGVAIGTMSLVKESCKEFCVYAGIPAKKIKERSRKLLALEKEFLNNLEEK
jgi:serine acetyltransferase